MCHTTDSCPPASPVVTGGIADSGGFELGAADGNRFRAFHAAPTEPNGRAIVLLPDLRGLHPFYEALAGRFAEAGFDTLVIDFYGRTAGTGPRDDDFDGMAHLPLLEPAHVEADAAAAVAWLRERGHGTVFSVGFCLGGGYSWRLAAAGLGLAGAVGFYGPPRFFGDRTDALAAPLLMLLAGDDVATGQAEFDALAAGFAAAGKPYEMHVYEGAPHSFFDAAYADWREACDDAWHRLVDFTERHAAAAA
ncbi:dienelactone hydrolase family protein [Yinghuangia seranimata]|uniref:dienelactone hydrolase family protein n=1 Tax=Yinghuangia seranimata TaxID=408067 RepID=UPI00248A9DE3|nr:dienelactone hydrolase family protein [Yinghuangia seranimata]MDI2126809.1 dienelactone hydrolase family protein [Yinghuangia seranimata]